MARWSLLLAIVLVVPSAGCTDLLVSHAGLEVDNPYRSVLYTGVTRSGPADAPNGTQPEPSGSAWVREVHRFEVPDGARKLGVHVAVEQPLPDRFADDRAQRVEVILDGNGTHRDASFGASGEEGWFFPEGGAGPWSVTVTARGSAEVFIVVSVQPPTGTS